MTNEQQPAPAYGEPWKPLQPDLIYDSCSYWMADAFNPEVRDRIVACVNACAGMADPAAEVQAMLVALREAHADLITISAHDGPGFPYGTCATLAGAGLAKLQPFIKP